MQMGAVGGRLETVTTGRGGRLGRQRAPSSTARPPHNKAMLNWDTRNGVMAIAAPPRL